MILDQRFIGLSSGAQWGPGQDIAVVIALWQQQRHVASALPDAKLDLPAERIECQEYGFYGRKLIRFGVHPASVLIMFQIDPIHCLSFNPDALRGHQE